MSFRLRITAWVVASCSLMIGVMIYSAYVELEEELRAGRVDQHHPPVPGWTIHNSMPEEEIRDILGELLDSWLWTAAVLIPVSLAGGLLLARRALRPVHDINRQLSLMKPDSLHGGISIPEADPAIADLASHLNGLLDKAGVAYREMAEFAEKVAHELRTPLMLLRIRLEHAPSSMAPEFLEELQDEIGRLSRHVERSLVTAKAEHGTLRPTPVLVSAHDLLVELADGYQLLAWERGLDMKTDLQRDLMILADRDLIRQALHGLLENSVRYASSWFSVSCRQVDGKGVLALCNDWDPQSRATSGLGLGLRLVHGICKASGIRMETKEEGGVFEHLLTFPNPQDAVPSIISLDI
jgi:signal transduction histidine kinase